MVGWPSPNTTSLDPGSFGQYLWSYFWVTTFLLSHRTRPAFWNQIQGSEVDPSTVEDHRCDGDGEGGGVET